jgi:hypothetical protein
MVYPKHIEWNGKITGHAPRRSQRELVAQSLQFVPDTRVRWCERTRSEYRTREG